MKWPSRPFIVALAFVALISGSAIVGKSFADSPALLELKVWTSEAHTAFGDLIQQGGNALENAIFNALDSVDLFSIGFLDREKAGIHIERAVYDNLDAQGTWTVIDKTRLRAEGNPPGAWTTLGETTGPFGTPYVSAVFEPQPDLEWTDVRQVQANLEPKRKHLEKLTREREDMHRDLIRQYGADAVADLPAPDPDVTELNPYTPWYYFDPSMRARFSKILNFFTFPFRMPLSVYAYQHRMADGEVISWGFSGRAEVGLAVGWKVMPDPTVQTAGVEYRVTAVGDDSWRISVLREDENHAKVKLSSSDHIGTHRRLTVGYERKHLVKHLLFIDGPGVSFKPLQIDDQVLKGKIFDVGYRYDLQTDEGKEAYHRAVLASFGYSEEIAARDLGKPNPAVEKVFERHGKTDDRSHSTRIDLSFIVRGGEEKRLNAIEAVILLPDGPHHVHSSVASKEDDLDTWFGSNSERHIRKISLLLDRDLYAKNDPDSFLIIGENTYEDSSTNGKELYRNVSEIEGFLGQTDIFPEISYSVPRRRGNPNSRKMKKAWFGRSSFYWGFHVRRPDIEAFLEIPPEERKNLVANFIPGDKQNGVLKNWADATDAFHRHSVADMFNSLKALFGDRKIGWNLMLLLRAAIPKPINAFVTAANSAFGRIQIGGKYQTSVDRILALVDQEMGFEGYSKRQKDDPEALLTDLTAEETTDGLIRVTFKMKEDAKSLEFWISRKRDLIGREVYAFQYANSRGLFHAGWNTFLLDPLNDEDLFHQIAEVIRRGRKYLFQISYSQDTKRFGSLAGVSFQAGIGYPAPRQNGDQVSNSSTGTNPDLFLNPAQNQ